MSNSQRIAAAAAVRTTRAATTFLSLYELYIKESWNVDRKDERTDTRKKRKEKKYRLLKHGHPRVVKGRSFLRPRRRKS